jgi:RNA-directed DNA polymerase
VKKFVNLYAEIISTTNLFLAWKVFRKGKAYRKDVMEFEWQLETYVFQLHRDLRNKKYRHGSYQGFYITDPKRRHIHKATVRDRVLHHAVYNKLYVFFDPTFIHTSFSCRLGKGTHKGVSWLERSIRKVSQNYTKPCYVLKCDIRRFFDSVDHLILLQILEKKIADKDTVWLLREIVASYGSGKSNLFERKGLPIGNLTSQLLANVYMNEFDQFVKRRLSVAFYARYTDDFVIVSQDKKFLCELLPIFTNFLDIKLKLSLHPDKVSIHKIHNGVDYLGYIIFPYHQLLRTKSRHRIYRELSKRIAEYKQGKVSEDTPKQSLQSYLGTLSHADAYEVREDLKNSFWYWLTN